jgi:hypothetical protein
VKVFVLKNEKLLNAPRFYFKPCGPAQSLSDFNCDMASDFDLVVILSSLAMCITLLQASKKELS